MASYSALSGKSDVGGRALAFHSAANATSRTNAFFMIYGKRNSPAASSNICIRKLTPSTNSGTRLYRYRCSCTGERMARAVLSDGVTLIKHVGPRGTGDKIDHVIPSYRNIASRNAVILDLAADPDLTQEMIAAMMDISQSTVSNVLRNS